MIPLILTLIVIFMVPGRAVPANGPISESTETCLGCHALSTPGIVADWKNSRHSRVTPQEALAKPPLERRVSAEVRSALAARGHKVQLQGEWSLGSNAAITVDPATGMLAAGADPRVDAYALAW